MFFLVSLNRNVYLHPSQMNATWQTSLRDILKSDVVGTCDGKTGYIMAISEIKSYGDGILHDVGGGSATFAMEFDAIVMKPIRGEVMDTVVTGVNSLGFYAECGPLTDIFVSHHNIPDDYEYDGVHMPPRFANADHTLTIAKDTEVRLRIVGIRYNLTSITAVATISQDFLGPMNLD